MANVRSWLLRLLLLTLLLPTGCALWFQQTHPPVQRTMVVPELPDAAFTRALLVTTDLGCALRYQDRQTRTLQAMYGTEASLTVTVYPRQRGSELQVVHQNARRILARAVMGRSVTFSSRAMRRAWRRKRGNPCCA